MNKNQRWNMTVLLMHHLHQLKRPEEYIPFKYKLSRGINSLKKLGWIDESHDPTKLGIEACRESGLYDSVATAVANELCLQARTKALEEKMAFINDTITTILGCDEFCTGITIVPPGNVWVQIYKWKNAFDKIPLPNFTHQWTVQSHEGRYFVYGYRLSNFFTRQDQKNLNADLDRVLRVVDFLNQEDVDMPQLEEFMEFDYDRKTS